MIVDFNTTIAILMIFEFSDNFRDSKEIMITSDSENRFKYFALSNNQSDNQSDSWIKAKFNSKQFKSTSPPCLQNQLRCVSGECIAVTQLCDKVT